MKPTSFSSGIAMLCHHLPLRLPHSNPHSKSANESRTRSRRSPRRMRMRVMTATSCHLYPLSENANPIRAKKAVARCSSLIVCARIQSILYSLSQSILLYTCLHRDRLTTTTTLQVPHRMTRELHLLQESTGAPQAPACHRLDRLRALATPKLEDRHRL